MPLSRGFFDELSSLLDVLASFQEPVFIVGDFIVRFERAADPVQRQFNELLASRGLSVRPTVPTHRDGGTTTLASSSVTR